MISEEKMYELHAYYLSDLDDGAFERVLTKAIMDERERCLEAFRCFEPDYAIHFIQSDSQIIAKK